MVDVGIKYRSKFQKIQLMIENVKSLGFDMGEYSRLLISIDDKVSKDIDTSYLSGRLVQGRMEQIYFDGIMELNKLEVALDRYSVYFEVLNNCKYLDIKLKNENMLEEELQKYVSQMIYNLKRIVKSNTISYEKEKEIVEKVYDTAYNVIKLELIMTGDSQLYHYAKEEDVNISFFNDLVLRDIDKLDLTTNDYESLKAKMYNLNSNGIASNYFDLELIKLLLVYDKSIDLKDSIIKKMEELKKQIISTNDMINNNLAIVNSENERVIKSREQLKPFKREIIKRLITSIVTTSLIITGGVKIERMVRKWNLEDSYLKTTEIYSSLNDTSTELPVSKNIYYSEPQKTVYIREYEPWVETDDKTYRSYKEYNVSHIDLDTAHDYYTYGIENYGVDFEKVIEDYSGSKSNMILYQDNYIEVLMNQYEYDGVVLDKTLYGICLVGSYLVYLLLLLGYMCVKTEFFNGNTDFEIILLIEAIVGYNDHNKDYNEKYQLLQDKVNELMKIINSNEEYRNKFRDLYEENKFLLDNPEELYQKINELGQLERIENAKKLVRENKKKK